MTGIDVRCTASRQPGDWSCEVRLSEDGRSTSHTVAVGRVDLDRLDPGATTPDSLVRRSFEFLLAREPRESILRSFELPVIGRYFPEFEREIARE